MNIDTTRTNTDCLLCYIRFILNSFLFKPFTTKKIYIFHLNTRRKYYHVNWYPDVFPDSVNGRIFRAP